MQARDPFLTGRRLSWAAAVSVGMAAVLTAASLRPLLPGGEEFAERMARISASAGTWALVWVVRGLSAILVLAFLIALSRTLTPGYPALRSVSVQIVTIGTAAEILGAGIMAVVVPPLASRMGAGEPEFRAVLIALEGVGVTLWGFIGTGLLCFGGALLCHAAYRTPPFPRGLALAGLFVWGPGILAAGATLSGSTRGIDIHTLLFMPVLALWTAGVAATHFRPPAGS